MEISSISKSTLKRLPMYLTYLKGLPISTQTNISATAIASALDLGEVQVRKDLASVTDSGKPKVGYVITELIAILETFLGYKDLNDAVVFGAGKLGRALLDYEGFNEYGLNIVAAFDKNKEVEGETLSGKPIFDISKFPDLCSRLKVRIGIITTPASEAQAICDLMVENGIHAIMNFAPTHLKVPDGIIVQHENIAASLAVLANSLHQVKN